MGDAEWLSVGLVLGILIGLPLGWLLLQALQPRQQQPQQAQQPASVIFERDETGRITGIHYVPR
jgi:Na+/glutamate symporter